MIGLTEVETHVIRMLSGGMTSAEIAFALDMPTDAVAQIADDVAAKLGVADRTEAITAALKTGLISTRL